MVPPGVPLLKWPGGKRALLPQLQPYLPREFGRYFEPFLGGGALFFATRPKKAVLSDANEELVECYTVIRDDPERLIEHLRRLKNTKTAYLAVRASKPRSPQGRAARFVYLSTLAFNGIYRVNLKGEFNVPYGWKKHLDVVRVEAIRATSHALKGKSLLCADFAHVLDRATEGDFVYLDPPYTVAHENNGFLKYNAKVFSWQDQARLADMARTLAQRGCFVLATNACHSSIRKLYHGLKQIMIQRPSRIAADGDHRGAVNELIITNMC